MFYPDGSAVMLGDSVVMGGRDGRVVCLIGDGHYTDDYPEAAWAYLERGVLIAFDKFGLIHYEHALEPDISLVRRQQ